MQTKKPPFDTSFARDFHWNKPEHDLQIVMLILGGHTERETCPAGAAEHAEILSPSCALNVVVVPLRELGPVAHCVRAQSAENRMRACFFIMTRGTAAALQVPIYDRRGNYIFIVTIHSRNALSEPFFATKAL